MCQIILSNPGTSRLCLDVTTIQKFSGTSSRHLLRLVAQLYLTLCNHMDCRPPGSSVHGDSPAKNTGVDCYALLQGNFHTQESNPGLPHCRQILYCLSHQGSPRLAITKVSLDTNVESLEYENKGENKQDGFDRNYRC